MWLWASEFCGWDCSEPGEPEGLRIALPKLLTSPHLSFSLRPMVPFLSQVSTYALEGLKGPGTLLRSGAGCECCAQPA